MYFDANETHVRISPAVGSCERPCRLCGCYHVYVAPSVERETRAGARPKSTKSSICGPPFLPVSPPSSALSSLTLCSLQPLQQWIGENGLIDHAETNCFPCEPYCTCCASHGHSALHQRVCVWNHCGEEAIDCCRGDVACRWLSIGDGSIENC